METRSKKRKQLTSPPNPYERIFARKSRDRSSVKDLRARRVFSPASISDVKAGIQGAEFNEKEADTDVGFGTKGRGVKTEIDSEKGNLCLGFDQKDQENDGNTEIGDTKAGFDVGLSQKDQKKDEHIEHELGSSCGDELVQATHSDGEIIHKSSQTMDMDREKTPTDQKFQQKDGSTSIGEGDKDEQAKSRVKSSVYVPCSRTKLYKNATSFSYRRLLPFLKDLTKDNSNSLEIHPCQNVGKSMEAPHPSLSASQNIDINGTHKKAATDEHPFGGSNTCPTLPSNLESPSMRSPRHPFIESTTLKTPKTSMSSTVNVLGIKEQPHLNGETLSQAPDDTLDRSRKSQDDPCFVHETNPPVKASCSLVVPEFTSIKDVGKLDKGGQNNNGNTEIKSSDGEMVQSTPPDSDVFCNPRPSMSKNEGDKDRHSNSKNKLGVLVPCSRMKLYKTPSSFSYRRLLPFLMDLAKNDTNAIGTIPSLKVDKTVDEVPPSPVLSSEEMLKNETNKEVLNNGQPFGGSDASLNLESAETTSPTSSCNVDHSNLDCIKQPLLEITIQDPVVESSIQKSPETSVVSDVNALVVMKPSDIYVERAPPAQQDMLDNCNIKSAHDATCIVYETNQLIKSSPSAVTPEPLLVKECAARKPILAEEVLDDCSVLEHKFSMVVKSPADLSLNQEPSNTECVAPSEKLVSGPSIGILKRYPRGCRGVCTCLTCASFHLHAERAFEFSRNQMQDTEELAMGLMKELTDIRTLLEKSVGDAQANPAVQVPQLQVQEACLKALRAEQLAKSHIKQMNEELSIHCRTPCLQRPRVRFADKFGMQCLE